MGSMQDDIKVLQQATETMYAELRHLRSKGRENADNMDSLSNDLRLLLGRIRAVPFHTDKFESIRLSTGPTETIGYSLISRLTYTDFEEIFRGSHEMILESLQRYEALLPRSGTGLDLGSGRGEMLEVMSRAGLKAVGVDNCKGMLATAEQRGLSVIEADIFDHMKIENSDSLDVVTAIHVIEHFPPSLATAFLSEIYRILRPEGLMIIETPNPHAIDALKAFWLDSTHVRPYYPESLLFETRKAGFQSAYVLVDGKCQAFYERVEWPGSYAIVARKGPLTENDYSAIRESAQI
jgi:SAM-dependent methyltransferase